MKNRKVVIAIAVIVVVLVLCIVATQSGLNLRELMLRAHGMR